MENEHRFLTLNQRCQLFKDNNEDKQELVDYLEWIENINKDIEEGEYHELKNKYQELSDVIESLNDNEKELIQRLYHNALFKLKREDSNLSKWEFFKDTCQNNNWSVVMSIIDKIEENDARYEKIRTGTQNVSESMIEKQYEQDKNDLDELHHMFEHDVKPWVESALSDYYKDLIYRTIQNRLNIIENRIQRNPSLSFSNWLKTTRKNQKMTLKDVADRSNTSASYIHRLEKGKRNIPSIPIIKSIAKALNTPYEEVLEVISDNQGDQDEKDQGAIPLTKLLKEEKYVVKNIELNKEQKGKLIDIVEAVFNMNEKDEYTNIVELPQLARNLQKDLEIKQEDEMVDFS